MKDATKVWDKRCEDSLEQMVSIFRKSIITDAELFAKFRGENTVNSQALELALYKSVMTLNESNKSIMFKKIGPEAMNLIVSLEKRAIADVSINIIEELEKDLERLPPEIQSIVKEIKKRLMGEDKEF